MTKKIEKFHKLLNKLEYSFIYDEINEITNVNYDGSIYFSLVTLPLPSKTIFSNNGDVCIYHLEALPKNLKFNNNGYVMFQDIKIVSDGIEFNNDGYVKFKKLKNLNKKLIFNNIGYVALEHVFAFSNAVIFNNTGNIFFRYLDEFGYSEYYDEEKQSRFSYTDEWPRIKIVNGDKYGLRAAIDNFIGNENESIEYLKLVQKETKEFLEKNPIIYNSLGEILSVNNPNDEYYKIRIDNNILLEHIEKIKNKFKQQ